MDCKIKFLGANSNFGELIKVSKSRYFTGISQTQSGRRGLYRVCYVANFYNPNNQIVAWLGSDTPCTTIATAFSKAGLEKFLKEYGYCDYKIE